MRALIVEQGASRGAVAGARGLAAAGWFVGVGAPGATGLAAASRACGARHHVPAAHEDLDGFLAATDAAVRSHGYEVVFGAGEAEVLALSAGRAELPAVVPYAPHETVRAALDKSSLEDFARDAGLLLPATLPPDHALDPAAPVVVKARRHAAPERPGAPPRVDTNVVLGAAAVRRRVAELCALGAEPVLQEFLDGPLVAYSAVTDRDSVVVAECMQAASRIWPPHAGASCRARSVPVDPHIAQGAAGLFKSLGWFGLAQLQFIVAPDGSARLIDLNGRFYGSLALALAAGVNLAGTWAAAATGRAAPTAHARAGVNYQWLEGDARRALMERRGGLIRDLLETIASAPRARHSLWDMRDPAPAVLRVRQLLGAQLAARSGRGR